MEVLKKAINLPMFERDRQETVTAGQLEKHLAKDHSAISVNSVQLAIQICLELLGTRTHIIPCVLPITAPPNTMAAVLRAGAQPILLDIDEKTLQLDATCVKMVLDETKGAVVILTQPGGTKVDPDLLELVQDVPTILDSRVLPVNLDNSELVCSFNVYDLSPVCESGAIIRHKWEEQRTVLRYLRSGMMGHEGHMPSAVAQQALERLSQLSIEQMNYCTVREELVLALAERDLFSWSTEKLTPLFVRIPNNAGRVVQQLRSYGIEALQAVFPLHLTEEVKNRFTENPSYPIAEKLAAQVIALPVYPAVKKHIPQIIQIIGEVIDG